MIQQRTGTVQVPEGHSIVVNFGFDFDSSSVWMESFGKDSPVYTSRGEYGALVCVPRILDLLDQYHIRATFFVPGHTADTFPDVVREIIHRGHEIGHHGYMHEDPTDLPYDQEDAIMAKGLETLDKLGVRPIGYRSPGFDFSPNTIEILEKYGIKYDSSLMGNDYYPYCPAPVTVHYDRGNEYGEPSNVVEMPVSWFLDDFPHSEFIMTRTGMKPQSQIYEIWKAHFDYGITHTNHDAMMAVAMHPQVIGRPHNISMLEQFINHIQENGAYLAPFGEIYDMISFE